MKNAIIILIFLSLALTNQYEDVIYLKDGNIIRGTIVEIKPNQYYKIKSDKNIFVLEMHKIDSIKKEVSNANIEANQVSNISTVEQNIIQSYHFQKGMRSFSGTFYVTKEIEKENSNYGSIHRDENMRYWLYLQHEFFATNRLSIGPQILIRHSDQRDYASFSDFHLGFIAHYYIGNNMIYISPSLLNAWRDFSEYECVNCDKWVGNSYSLSVGKLFNISDNAYIDLGYKLEKIISTETDYEITHWEKKRDIEERNIIYVGLSFILPGKNK